VEKGEGGGGCCFVMSDDQMSSGAFQYLEYIGNFDFLVTSQK
jgi:hypothetical protein